MPMLIGIGLPTLRELRKGVLIATPRGESGSDAVHVLREAGYAGGTALFDAFEHWLNQSESVRQTPAEKSNGGSNDDGAGGLSLPEFEEHASRFFRDAGWGEVSFAAREEDGIAEVEITDCWESADGTISEMPGCHVTTGMLAAFFERIAGFQIAVFETDCRGSGGSRCCFAMGNADVMQFEWEKLA
ncbi:MAG: 4-vinyl reductase [Gemmatimonadaceae bacterium]